MIQTREAVITGKTHTDATIEVVTAVYEFKFEIGTGNFDRHYHAVQQNIMNPNGPEIIVLEIDETVNEFTTRRVTDLIDEFSETLCVVVVCVKFPKSDLFDTNVVYYVENINQVEMLTDILLLVYNSRIRVEVILGCPVDNDILKSICPIVNIVTVQTVDNALAVHELNTNVRLAFNGSKQLTPRMIKHIGAEIDFVHVFNSVNRINFDKGVSRIINKNIPTCVDMCASHDIIVTAEKLSGEGEISDDELTKIKQSIPPCSALSYSLYYDNGVLYPCHKTKKEKFGIAMYDDPVRRVWNSRKFNMLRNYVTSCRRDCSRSDCPLLHADIEDILGL